MRYLFILLSCCLFTVSGVAFAPEPDSTISLEELHKAILRNEEKLLNLQVNGKYYAEEWNDKENTWQFAGQAEITAYFPNAPGSKFRIDFHKEVLPWVDGPAPVSEDVYSLAYNGRYAQTLYRRTGAPNKPYTTLRGQVKAKRPDISATGACASGWKFSLYGFGDRIGKRISNCFNFNSKDTVWTAEKSQFNGKECVKLTIEGAAKEVLYFDPEHGYALLGYESMTSKGVLTQRIIVQKLMEPNPGIYYPGKATQYLFNSSGKPRVRKHYEASAVVVNDPEFADDIFTINWPDGTIIHDEMVDLTFIVGRAARDLDFLLDLQVTEARTELAKTENQTNTADIADNVSQPNSVQAVGASPSSSLETHGDALKEATSTKQELSKQNKWILVMVFIAVGLAVVLIFVFLSKGKKLRTHSVLLLALMSFLMHQVVLAREFCPAIQELGRAKVFNCGLNTSAFVLKYFGLGHSVDLVRLSDQLEAGAHWENAVSILSIKNTLQARGLKVEAFKNATFDEIFRKVNKEEICIIHVLLGDAKLGHYYVVIAAREKKVFLVNAGRKASWLLVKELKKRYEPLFTGFCLFVSSEEATKEKTNIYSLDAKKITIDLGDIILGQGTITAKVPILNSSDKNILITKVVGGCRCFKGAALKGNSENGAFRIKPRSRETILLSFDREKFGKGQVRQLVLLNISQPEAKKVIVEINANIVETPEKKIAWFPEKIDYGLVLEPNQIARKQVITLLLPHDIVVSKIQTSSASIKLSPIEMKTKQNSSDNTAEKRRIYEYKMVLLEVPEKDFAEHIEFLISSETMPKITIPVIGRIQRF